MSVKTLTKTITQHTKELDQQTITFLQGIAEDYAKVKNAVYQRYSGIRHVDSLTPVYDILNEMRRCGLREQLNLPVVYYELAVADAVTNIKTNWAVLKRKINDLVTANENLNADEKMYIRTVLKINSTFSAILNRKKYETPNNVKDLKLDTARLNNRICRMVRTYLSEPKTEATHIFKVSPNGYRYKDGGIYLVSRIPRKRIFVPLKSKEQYDRQILFILGENSATLQIPVETRIREHADYTNTIFMHIGNKEMLTLSNGNIYGEIFEQLVFQETLRLDKKNQERDRLRREAASRRAENLPQKAEIIEKNNLGRRKYDSRKATERANTVRYINTEINRMLREEKPSRIVIPSRVLKNSTRHYSRMANLRLTRSFQGYIRERLAFKCQIHSVELLEVNSKGTRNRCAVCGAEGKCLKDEFVCESCGIHCKTALNSARNVEKKYQEIDSPAQRISE